MLATSTLRHSRMPGLAPRRASCVSVRRICLERRVVIDPQGSSFIQGPFICLALCRAADVASVGATLPPYSSLFAAVSISHGGADSNTVGSSGAPVRLSARTGRTSLHHRFASAGAVLVRRASVCAWCVARLGVQEDLPPPSRAALAMMRSYSSMRASSRSAWTRRSPQHLPRHFCRACRSCDKPPPLPTSGRDYANKMQYVA